MYCLKPVSRLNLENYWKNKEVKIEKLVWYFFLQSSPIFFSQKGRLLSPKQKVFRQLCDYLRFWGSKSFFLEKCIFLARKWHFFKKNLIQNWSGIKTTSYAHAIFFQIKLHNGDIYRDNWMKLPWGSKRCYSSVLGPYDYNTLPVTPTPIGCSECSGSQVHSREGEAATISSIETLNYV